MGVKRGLSTIKRKLVGRPRDRRRSQSEHQHEHENGHGARPEQSDTETVAQKNAPNRKHVNAAHSRSPDIRTKHCDKVKHPYCMARSASLHDNRRKYCSICAALRLSILSHNQQHNSNQAEVGHSCRGIINLKEAFIHTENACNFAITSGSQTFHLKAASEVDRQKWVTALELSKHKAIRADEADEEEHQALEQELSDCERQVDVQGAVQLMQTKIQDLVACQDMLVKHGHTLHKSMNELEKQVHQTPEAASSDLAARFKVANERATLYRITADAMTLACNEFVSMAQTQTGKWQRMLQHEHEQRLQLQDQIEQLAKQHSVLEKVALKGDHAEHLITTPVYSDSDDDTTFVDAPEELSTSRAHDTYHRSQSNEQSGAQGDGSSEQLQHDAAKKKFQQDRAQTEGYFSATIVQRQDRTPTSESSRAASLRSSRDGSGERAANELAECSSSTSLSAQKDKHKHKSMRVRRSSLPPKPQSGVSLWSIMRNCIGKELSKIPMPVNFNEPLSFLQRICEDLEYSDLLDRAARKSDASEQLSYIAAFFVSTYSTSSNNRATKPFNPLLGETYENDRYDDLGWRSIAEQVSHHPPVAAHHVEGAAGWQLYQEFSMTSKFRGKYLSVIPTGVTHLHFTNSGHHYTWRRVTTTVHNIIVGKLWIDHHGEAVIENHSTRDKCVVKFFPYSYFSKEPPRKVTAIVQSSDGSPRWVLQGVWDTHMDCMKVLAQDTAQGTSPVLETNKAKRIWTKNPPLEGSEKFYNFTKLAVELNEPEEGVAPTDCRNRPDQRHMEIGEWDMANAEKVRLEDKQRTKRRAMEQEAELQGRAFEDSQPVWFNKNVDEWEGGVLHVYNGQYWKCKELGDWSRCPQIF